MSLYKKAEVLPTLSSPHLPASGAPLHHSCINLPSPACEIYTSHQPLKLSGDMKRWHFSTLCGIRLLFSLPELLFKIIWIIITESPRFLFLILVWGLKKGCKQRKQAQEQSKKDEILVVLEKASYKLFITYTMSKHEKLSGGSKEAVEHLQPYLRDRFEILEQRHDFFIVECV